MPARRTLSSADSHARFARGGGVLCALAAAVGALVGCGDGDKPIPVTEVRDRSKTEPAPELGVPADERLAPMWRFDVPPGWRDVENPPSSKDRIATFLVAGRDDVSCVLSVLANDGGGLAANVNRWRQQMGLDAATDEAIAALPKRPFLGGDVPFIELAGTYSGMSGAMKLENARMLGLVLALPQVAVFLKAVGPSTVLEAEREHFLALAASTRWKNLDRLRRREAAESGASSDAGAATEPPHGAKPTVPSTPATPAKAPAPAAASAGPFQFVAPPGWKLGPQRPMRIATLTVEGAEKVEISVHEFPQGAGGALDNVNRWRSHMNLAPIDDAGLAALPKIPMLGGEALLVELSGHLVDSMRKVDIADATQMGAIFDRGASTVFIRMTGPAAEVGAQKAAFLAFAASMTVR